MSWLLSLLEKIELTFHPSLLSWPMGEQHQDGFFLHDLRRNQLGIPRVPRRVHFLFVVFFASFPFFQPWDLRYVLLLIYLFLCCFQTTTEQPSPNHESSLPNTLNSNDNLSSSARFEISLPPKLSQTRTRQEWPKWFN